MMSHLASVLLVAFQAAGGVQTKPNAEELRQRAMRAMEVFNLRQPPVMLTAPVLAADGSRQGPLVSAVGALGPMFVTSAAGSCDASFSTTAPAEAREGWRIGFKVVSRGDRSALVRVEWQRLWARGRAVTSGTGATVEVTVGSGERVPLDQVVVAAPGLPCDGRVRLLELQLGGGIVISSSDRPVVPPPAPVHMQVWVVHTAPSGEEVTYHQTLPFNPADTGFTFRTPPITSPAGVFQVEIEGRFRAVAQDDGSPGLWAGLTRTIVDGSSGTTRSSGGSRPIVAWGAPGDVISFDLPLFGAPPSAGSGGGGGGGRGTVQTGGRGGVAGRGVSVSTTSPLLGDHRFSLRLRFTPAQ